jgi:hypothetical protein
VGGGAMFFDSQSGTMARGSGVFPPPLKPRPTTILVSAQTADAEQ